MRHSWRAAKCMLLNAGGFQEREFGEVVPVDELRRARELRENSSSSSKERSHGDEMPLPSLFVTSHRCLSAAASGAGLRFAFSL